MGIKHVPIGICSMLHKKQLWESRTCGTGLAGSFSVAMGLSLLSFPASGCPGSATLASSPPPAAGLSSTLGSPGAGTDSWLAAACIAAGGGGDVTTVHGIVCEESSDAVEVSGEMFSGT